MSGPAAGAATARHQAQAILRESRFHDSSAPHPLRALLRSFGSVLQSVERGLLRAVARLGAHLPGGRVTAWALAIIGLGVLVAGVVRLIGTRRIGRRALRSRGAPLGEPPLTAAALESRADEAEREHRYELALRLRFRAGLAGLAERGRVPSPESRASVQLSDQLASEDFDMLAARFDEVVYGGRRARHDDLQEARRRWPAVLAERSVQ